MGSPVDCDDGAGGGTSSSRSKRSLLLAPLAGLKAGGAIDWKSPKIEAEGVVAAVVTVEAVVVGALWNSSKSSVVGTSKYKKIDE